MVTQSSKNNTQPGAEPPVDGASVKDSAQQIWQAGLGAFNKAQEEGSKAFEALVKEGVRFQQQTHQAAEEKLAETARKMTSLTSDMSAKATGQWDKLENIFEDRVAKALHKLGIPSAQDVSDLSARIDELTQSVQQLSAQVAALQKPAKPAKTAKAAKPASPPRA